MTRELPTLSEAMDTVLHALSQLPRAASDVTAPRHPTPDSDSRTAWLVIGAERGFCGAFNAHLANDLLSLRRAAPRANVLVASRRLYDLMGEGASGAIALPGCAAVEDSAGTIDASLDAIAPFTTPAAGEVWLLQNTSHGVQRSRLWPNAHSTPAAMTEEVQPPLHHLAWPTLRDALLRQALRLQLQVALHESLSQENHWRLTQMQLAQDHLDELGRALRRKRATLRQAQITNELETLLSGVPGSSSRRSQARSGMRTRQLRSIQSSQGQSAAPATRSPLPRSVPA